MKRVLMTYALGLSLSTLLAACGDDSAPVGADTGGTSSSAAGEPGSTEAGHRNEGGTGSGAAMGGGAGGEGGAENPSAGASTGGSAGSPATAGSGGLTGYLPCESEADCDAFGGGKVCCVVGAMHFCTKPSACPGETLP
jgi:hypothetical protein